MHQPAFRPQYTSQQPRQYTPQMSRQGSSTRQNLPRPTPMSISTRNTGNTALYRPTPGSSRQVQNHYGQNRATIAEELFNINDSAVPAVDPYVYYDNHDDNQEQIDQTLIDNNDYENPQNPENFEDANFLDVAASGTIENTYLELN